MKKFAVIILLVMVMMFSGCNLINQRIANRMIEKYSDNQNYVSLQGDVVEITDNIIIIKCEELHDYLNYEDEFCDYYIHSKEIIKLSVGDKIDFVTVPLHFYDGQHLPIVELKKDGNTLLSFEEGKENLIFWVKTNFK